MSFNVHFLSCFSQVNAKDLRLVLWTEANYFSISIMVSLCAPRQFIRPTEEAYRDAD